MAGDPTDSQAGNEVWPPAPDCPPVQTEPRPSWLRCRLGLFLPGGLVGLCLSGWGWIILAHGLLLHVPPPRYYHYLMPLALVGFRSIRRGKTTRLEDTAAFSSMLLAPVAYLMEILHIAHYF